MRFPNDTGPIYLETVEGRFPVEPFNTYSNLVFLAILVYWGYHVYRNPRQQLFLAWVFPILLMGYIGGTLYHATRSAEIWLLLDWIPIMVLCAALVIYFIFKIVEPWWQRMLWITLLLGGSYLVRVLPMPHGLRISLGYVITAVTVLLPLVWYLVKTHWKNGGRIATAFIVFALAVFFRSIDLKQDFLHMGTHWLWHFLGGMAVHFLIGYIYHDNLLNLASHKAAGNDRYPKGTLERG